MFSHIFVGADDVALSKRFYDAVLGAIGVPEGKIDPKGRFSIAPRPALSELPSQSTARQSPTPMAAQ
jgi:hypothetical protein